MTAITYHETVNDAQGPAFCARGPFARRDWFALLEQAGHRPIIAAAWDGRDLVSLALTRNGRTLEALTNWYAFTWTPSATNMVSAGPLEDLVRDLAGRASRIELAKLPDEDGSATQLEHAFRRAGWLVRREQCDTNHYLPVNGRSFVQYLASRPGPLRTTLKRKGKKVEMRLSQAFDPADWAVFEDIYSRSWKPAEGEPALLRAFARREAALGHLRFGLALANGSPVAAQFWTVEGGKAYIHKLAHLPEAEPLSPGTTLTAALMEQVIDRDQVAEVDFGTGDDGYKADWMDAVRPRWRLTCLRAGSPRNWPELGKWAVRRLVSRPHAD